MEYKELIDLMRRNRSYRRFDPSRAIGPEELDSIISAACFCASGRNMQPLKYRRVFAPGECARVFPLLAWAGYLKDWNGPEEGERPTAYLVQCLDRNLAQDCMCDDGLQLEALTLAAVSLGLGCCIIKSFDRVGLVRALGLPANLEPLYVLAIGRPVEEVEIEDMRDGDVRYYRTPDAVHHVPKRALSELTVR